MTDHLLNRIKITLTLPTGMSLEGGFAEDTPAPGIILKYTTSQARFVQWCRYRSLMTIANTGLQSWPGRIGKFKSP
jgi:hypothetical protein